MPGCERCWRDAGIRAFARGGDKVDHYNEILDERKETPCSPEEQCGELHVVFDWKDGGTRCVCGAVVTRLTREERKAQG